jgi:hypothetical protein
MRTSEEKVKYVNIFKFSGQTRSVNAFPSSEHNKEAVLAAIHSSAGPLCTLVGHWRRRPPGYLAVFSTFARFRPITVFKLSDLLLITRF